MEHATYQLAGETIVHDLDTNRQLFWIAAVVVLPVGSEIELVNPNVNAKVARVRLLAAPSKKDPVRVCLDVRIPKGPNAAVEAENLRRK